MTTTALMRYHQQQQRNNQQNQHHQQQQSQQPSNSSSATSDSASILSPQNGDFCNSTSHNNSKKFPLKTSNTSVSRNNDSPNEQNGNNLGLLENGFTTAGINVEENVLNGTSHSKNSEAQVSSRIEGHHHNLNNEYGYHNNNVDRLHPDSDRNSWRSSCRKHNSGYIHGYPTQLWGFIGAQVTDQSTPCGVTAIQHAVEYNSTLCNSVSDSSSYDVKNHASAVSITPNATSTNHDSSALALLGDPTEQNVTDLAKKLLAEASSALKVERNSSVDEKRTATVTSTTKVVKTTSIAAVLDENGIPQKQHRTETSKPESNQKRIARLANEDISPENTKSSSGSSPTDSSRSQSQSYVTLATCRKTSVFSESPPNSTSSSNSKNLTSCATSFTSISASSSSSSTPSCSGVTTVTNSQKFAHPTALMPLMNSVAIQESPCPSLLNANEKHARSRSKSKGQKHLPREEPTISNNDNKSFFQKKTSLPNVDIQNLSLSDLQKQEKKFFAKSESDYCRVAKSSSSSSSESLHSSLGTNINNDIIGNSYHPNSHHETYIASQHGSHNHFQRSTEEVKVSWTAVTDLVNNLTQIGIELHLHLHPMHFNGFEIFQYHIHAFSSISGWSCTLESVSSCGQFSIAKHNSNGCHPIRLCYQSISQCIRWYCLRCIRCPASPLAALFISPIRFISTR